MTLGARRLTEIVFELMSRPGHEKVRALMYELLVYGLGASSTDIYFERHMPEVCGRLDALLGQTVFEFKRDLRREKRTAEEELGRYLPQRELETGERFIGIATDGAEFLPYEIEGGRLEALPAFHPSADDPTGLLLWLDAAVSLRPDLSPEPNIVRAEIGRDSLAYRRALSGLGQLWHDVKEVPEVRLKRMLWADFLAIVYGGRVDADSLFLQHTYLTIVAKTMATRILAIPLPEPEDLLSGRPFHEAGIAGAVESDFFDWVLHAPAGRELVARLSRQVARFRLHDVAHDVLKDLYESLVDPDQRHDLGEYYTPEWLAARVCARAVSRPLEQRVLDPACGSGTFLFHAVRLLLAAADDARLSDGEALRLCLDRVIGIDVHPVAVLVARVTYLLAIGEERLRSRPEKLALPVYLGDALQWNTQPMRAHVDLVIHVPDGPDLLFPGRLADDPTRFDDTVKTMLDLSEENADDASFRAWVEREGVSSDHDVDVLVATYGHLRTLRQTGRDHIWGYVARNLARPLWLSSPFQRADVIVANPPWLPYRHLCPRMRSTFREECRRRGLWSGGKLAAHHDLSAYFFARAAELYLREAGIIAFVMPYGALSRAHFAGFRSGRFHTADVRFTEAWVFDEGVQPLFPVPSSVIFAERRPAAPLPATVQQVRGRLPRRDASAADADRVLTTSVAAWPSEAKLSGASPYRSAFRQGATMVPRRLCLVELVASGRLGSNPTTPLVESRSCRLEKPPWHRLAPLRHVVEAQFLRPLYLGESIAPYRVLRPALAVVPWDETANQLLDASAAQGQGFPGLARWLEAAERLWRENSRSGMPLARRWDYLDALHKQLPPEPVRVVYVKSGQVLAATIIEDTNAIIDHKLYWASFPRYAEALYVTAVFNSETLRGQIADLQSRGRWGARDFDKLILEVPIPRFDSKDALHLELMSAALEAERIAGMVPLPEDLYFVNARQRVREALRGAGLAARIDSLVAELLAG